MIRVSRFASAILLLAAATACSKAQARTPGPVTALDMPPAPERVLIPVVLSAPAPPAPAEPEAAPAAPPPSQPRNTAGSARPAERPETAPPAPETPTPPVLQTTADVAAVERRIQGFVAQAQQNLDRIRPGDLNASARAQFEQARTFIRMAGEAMKIKNYSYAEELASKAAAVAGQLVKG
jgi:hypothetical protein